MSDSLLKRIEALEKVYLVQGIDHGMFYDLISEMERCTAGFDEHGSRITDDAVWEEHFNNRFMSRKAFIADREEFHNIHGN